MFAAKTLDTVHALNRILDIATAFWKSQTFFTERTETEYASLLQTAGFVGVEVQRLGAPRDLILARKT